MEDLIFDLEELKNNSNFKLGWLTSWNKEVDPPTYILKDITIWFFYKESDDNLAHYQRIEGYDLPTDLIW